MGLSWQELAAGVYWLLVSAVKASTLESASAKRRSKSSSSSEISKPTSLISVSDSVSETSSKTEKLFETGMLRAAVGSKTLGLQLFQ